MKLAVFAAGLAALVSLQPFPARAAPDDSVLEIPFDPPVNVPLRYRIITEKESDEKTSRATAEQELIFRRVGKGYEVSISTLTISDGTTTLTPDTPLQGAATLALDMMQAVTLELDNHGQPIRVVDWPEQRAKLARLPQLLIADEPAEKLPTALESANRIIAPFLRASAEEAVGLLVKHWPNILGWGGTALAPGEPYSYSGEAQSPLVPVMLPQDGTVTIVRSDTDGYRLTLLETTAPEAVEATLISYFESLGEPGDAKHAEVMERVRTAFAGAQNFTRMDVTFAAGTGLIQSAVVERQFDFAIGSGVERVTIERLE
jgi:hypothetical protein